MPKNRTSITLSAETERILADIEQPVSQYLCDLVEQRRRDVSLALVLLRSAGWQTGALCAAMDVLNGYAGLSDIAGITHTPGAVALELHDGQALNAIASKWEVAGEWPERVQQVSSSREIADALCLVARQFWLGDQWVVRRVEG